MTWRERLLRFWFGPPCRHGFYGHCYNGQEVIECRECRRDIDERVRGEIERERRAELNAAFGGIIGELERRIAKLEGGSHA